MNLFLSSTVYKNFNDVVNLAEEVGCNIEISRFGNLSTLDDNFKNTLKLYKEALQNFDGLISLHGFFFDLNPASADPQIRAVTHKRYNMIFEAAQELEAKTIVFHTSFNPLFKHPVYNKQFMQNYVEFWQNFIPKFERANITAVLENTIENSPAVILEILDAVNSSNLKACIDVGHANINSNKSVEEWICAFGKKLAHMHLHNNYGDQDAHNSILKGTLDFDSIFETLRSNNLSPDLVFEIFKDSEALESIEYFRKSQKSVSV